MIRFLKEQLARIAGSLRRRNFDHEMDEEIEAHLALLTQRFVARGLPLDEAQYAARREFGGVMQLKNEVRERSRFRPFENLLQDSTYVVRQFRKSPLFAIAAVLTLALGIGANTAIFTLIDQLILRLLPVSNPQEIVALVGRGEYYGSNMGEQALSYTMYQTIRDRNPVFAAMMCRRSMSVTATFHAQGEVLSAEVVSGNYFPLLGINAGAGRLFTADDDLRPGAHPVAVLSYAYWKNRLAADAHVIGSKVLVNNYPFTIVGVAQPGFSGLEPGLPTQLFVPIMMTPTLFPNADFQNMFDARLRWVNVYGRLKPGIDARSAKAGLQPMFHQILQSEVLQPSFGRATPFIREHFLKMWIDVLPGGQGSQVLRRRYQKPLAVLMGVTGFVLLIACANLASLLAAKAVVRRREIAIRLALGSSRGRIVQQLLTESLLLALAGAVAGVCVAVVMVKVTLAFLPDTQTGYLIASSPDWRVLLFAFALALLTGVTFGLAPALQAAYPNIAETLKTTAANVAGGGTQILFRKGLVALQITLSLLLLTGAGLFVRSLANLRSINPGFETQNVVQFDVDVDPAGYDQPRSRTFYNQLETRLRHLPGVESVGYANVAVLDQNSWQSEISVAGHENKPGENRTSHINRVSGGFFQTMGIHVLAGRVFDQTDIVGTPSVVVVNESFARHYFGDRSAVGHLIGRGSDPNTPATKKIVGVVNDTHYEDLVEAAPRQVYLCNTQDQQYSRTVYLRAKGDGRNILASAQRAVHQLEPQATITELKTLEHQVEESLSTERMITTLSTGFSVLATALSVLGLYGVMAYMVTQRAREIGIRVALGAMFGNVVWLVMREVIVMVLIGVAAALPLTFGLARFVQSELFGVQATDPASIAFATLTLSLIAMIAGYLPARRAATADPLRVLRYE